MTPLYLPSSEEMAALDRRTIEAGVPSLELMERAGKAAFDFIMKEYAAAPGSARVLVLCGPGNNGGDGAVIARLLKEAGCSVEVAAAHADRRSADLQSNLSRLSDYYVVGGPDGRGRELSEPSFERLVRASTLVVDCLLGTGQRDAPRGIIASMCRAAGREATAHGIPVVSIDVPTGVDATTGSVFEPHFVAAATVAVQCLKRGLFQYPARGCCGAIEIVEIGIEVGEGSLFSLFDPTNHEFPERAPDAHKGDFKKVWVLGGAPGMLGASVLAAHGALRTGAPLVTRVLTGKDRLESHTWPEIMHGKISALSKKGASEFAGLAERGIAVIGPGLGISPGAKLFVESFIERAQKRRLSSVIDADGLNCIAALSKKKRRSLGGSVMTPHPGEAARLLSVTTDMIQSDRYGAAQALYDRYGAAVILKGTGTIVFDGERGSVNPSGNPFLATGGSGDVLSGVVAGLMAQGLSPGDAARWGAYLHGRAGDIAHNGCGGPIIASDIIDSIPPAIGEMFR